MQLEGGRGAVRGAAVAAHARVLGGREGARAEKRALRMHKRSSQPARAKLLVVRRRLHGPCGAP